MIELLPLVEPLIRAHAAEDAPLEAVGLVFADGSIQRLINQARSRHRFAISRSQLTEVLAAAEQKPVCLYHSHPTVEAKPSLPDRAIMRTQMEIAGISIPFLILGTDGLRVWLWQNGEAVEVETEP